MYSRAEGIADHYWPWPVFLDLLQNLNNNLFRGYAYMNKIKIKKERKKATVLYPDSYRK